MTWIKGQQDDPTDLCAHGKVHFEIDGQVLVNGADGEWTVSASALYLLRTLESDHKKEAFSFQQLFPCCGFNMYDNENIEDVGIFGCPNGIDFEIIHETSNIRILSDKFEPVVISLEDWQKAVIGFSKSVMAFYAASSPKEPETEMNAKGYNKFMVEWNRRYKEAVSELA